jgi:phenylpropionate dioxygenase-like ring-hydroxylating dioxygenase large terminal subunit
MGGFSMNDMSDINGLAQKPVVIPVEAYTSETYARDEKDKLWSKVWQTACRVEEIPKVGDYVTYDILDESIIVVRTARDRIQAFYNVCQHRGRRLTEGCGHTAQFYCRFHGWRWDINGESAFVLDLEDWQGALNPDNLRLKPVKVDAWGGWVWINMDPNCQTLREYLEPAVSMLTPYELDKMRYSWRQWIHFPCNWKVALEAFNESFHADVSHPELARFGTNAWWCKGENHCGWHGQGAPRTPGQKKGKGNGAGTFVTAPGADARVVAAEFQLHLVDTLNAMTTATLVNVAKRLVDELPPGTPAEEVAAYMMAEAEREDAARGVIWPKIDFEHMAACGHDWHLFPNLVFLYGPTFALCYRARPNGYDPNSCIFEVSFIERHPEGQEPKTEWVFQPDPSEEKWLLVLAQDFANMGGVQKGIKSRGYQGARPSPIQEGAVIHFHRVLAKYMGTGAPKRIS